MVNEEQIIKQLDPVKNTLQQVEAVGDVDSLWAILSALLKAPAPSGGAGLPGTITDVIQAQISAMNLADRLQLNFKNTGNLAVSLGAEREQADVIISAHIDRPSFRLVSIESGELYPISANRFPQGHYEGTARAFRFEDGQIITGAVGRLISERGDGGDTLHFVTESGSLHPGDTITLAADPMRDGEKIIASGLDNSMGVSVLLMTLAVYQQLEPHLIARDLNCLFVFTDNEEAPPDGFFGNGAARLRFAVPPPRRGVLNVDGQNSGGEFMPVLGQGCSHAFVAGQGRGAIVPMQYQTLAIDLAAQLNQADLTQVQMHYGYQSRSDDMVYSRWTRVLGLLGVPLLNAHTCEETVHPGDVQQSVRWLAYLLWAALGQIDGFDDAYALLR